MLACLGVVRLAAWLLPETLPAWDAQATDLLFRLRSVSPRLQPEYSGQVVHVDISDQSLRKMSKAYLSRAEFAKCVENLDAMHVAAQGFDFVLAAPAAGDGGLIEAVAEAGNVYFGIATAVEGGRRYGDARIPKEVGDVIAEGNWHVRVADADDTTPHGSGGLVTFPALAEAVHGLGHLNVTPDADGTYRRVPLLIRIREGYYPSFSLRIISDYLEVRAEDMTLYPRERLVLSGVRREGHPTSDVSIPLDSHGNMVVNFVGTWERMTHYDFADVLNAADDRDELDLWREELEGKIVIVSETTTGSADIGQVPTDTSYPLSGIHANAIQTVLSGRFLHEGSDVQFFAVNAMLAVLVWLLALRCTPLRFALAAGGLAVVYVALGMGLFLFAGVIIKLVQPSLFIGLSLVSILAYRYVDELEGQVRDRTEDLKQTHAKLEQTQEQLIEELEKELQTAHDMQMSLMPKGAPVVPGIEMAGRCVPATHVGGDFYKFFQRDDSVSVAMADVTGHGMEAAIPVVMFSGILDSQMEATGSLADRFVSLNRSLCRSLADRTFVCFCMAEIDSAGGMVRVLDCGCPYPLRYDAATGEVTELRVDAYPLGVRPRKSYEALESELSPGDYLILFSDGIPEAAGEADEMFGFERTIETVRQACVEELPAEAVVERVLSEVGMFCGDQPQEDDQTIVVVARQE